MNIDNEDSTIAVCRCGRVVFAVVTHAITKGTRANLMGAMLDGCDIRHVTAAEVRKMDWLCECPRVRPRADAAQASFL